MNLFKALFLCLYLERLFSVDRSLQAFRFNELRRVENCAYALLRVLDKRPKPVDETTSYQQMWFSTASRSVYRMLLRWLFHRAYAGQPVLLVG
jgi:hypothetical protein